MHFRENAPTNRVEEAHRDAPMRSSDPREDACRDHLLPSCAFFADWGRTDGDDRITPRVIFPAPPAHQNRVGAY